MQEIETLLDTVYSDVCRMLPSQFGGGLQWHGGPDFAHARFSQGGHSPARAWLYQPSDTVMCSMLVTWWSGGSLHVQQPYLPEDGTSWFCVVHTAQALLSTSRSEAATQKQYMELYYKFLKNVIASFEAPLHHLLPPQ